METVGRRDRTQLAERWPVRAVHRPAKDEVAIKRCGSWSGEDRGPPHGVDEGLTCEPKSRLAIADRVSLVVIQLNFGQS
jgi:hypothetical protein